MKSKVGIHGLGFMGASYAKGLSDKGWIIYGYDLQEETVNFCHQQGWIKNSSNAAFPWQELDVWIYAGYPSSFVETLLTIQNKLKSGCLLSDMLGVKTSFLTQIEAQLRSDVVYISHHPMAGKEVVGAALADPTVFRGANFIFIDSPQKAPEQTKRLKDIAEALEFQRFEILTSEEHDRIIGYVSQLTHLLAVSLMLAQPAENYVGYTGDSFRDLTRIAKINGPLWKELFFANKSNVLQEIEALQKVMEELKNYIQKEDAEPFLKAMQEAKRRRFYFEKGKSDGNNH